MAIEIVYRLRWATGQNKSNDPEKNTNINCLIGFDIKHLKLTWIFLDDYWITLVSFCICTICIFVGAAGDPVSTILKTCPSDLMIWNYALLDWSSLILAIEPLFLYVCLYIYNYFYLFHDLFYHYLFLSFSPKLCDDSWLPTHGCVENHPALLPITDPMLYTTENQVRTLNQAEPQSMFSDCDVRFLDRSGMFQLQSPWTHL